MVSYIIIGRNEGWKLELCLKSVYESIAKNRYIESEVIYIDSNSTDNSLEIAKQFYPISIFQLTQDYNAAIARNLGAKKAKGDILFFIDADMEIESGFLQHIINQNGELSYGFIGGYYINKVYDENWVYQYSFQFPGEKKLKSEFFIASTGGLFIISKKLWLAVGGMKNYLTGGEDPDLAIRLSKLGVFKLYKNKLMATHHTRSPRMNFRFLLSDRSFKGRILLIRENLFSRHAIKRLFRQEYTALFLIGVFALTFFYIRLTPVIVLIYFLLLAGKSLKKSKNFKHVPHNIFKDLILIFGFLFYWPGKKSKIVFDEVEVMKDKI